MVSIDQRISQRIVFIGKLDRRRSKRSAFLHTVPFGKRTGRHIAYDHLKRYDSNLLHHGFTVGKLLNEMGSHALLLQQPEQVVAHHIVDCALACDRSFFLSVERSRIILIGYNNPTRIIGCKHLFCFAFIQLCLLFHVQIPPLYE